MTEKYGLKQEEVKILENIGLLTKYKRPIAHKDEAKFQTLYYDIEDNNITEINLDGSELNTLPDSISHFKSLKKLSLKSNSLTTLPESIGELKSLQELNMEGAYRQKLTYLPESIGQLESLKILNVSGHNLTTLPESIGNLKSLQELNLKGNQLTSLPESIGNLESLIQLDLEHNKLKKLPESIGDLITLQKLILNSNDLIHLPKSIGNLKSLQEIYLRENNLSTLPESIGNLTSLQILFLLKNDIITLPESIGNLNSLREINLVRNLLITLPESIGSMESLEKLYLADNKLLTFPETIGNLKSLKELGLGYNELSNFPRSIGNLENLVALALENNKFTSLPGSIWPLKNLKQLNLERNPWDGESQEIISKGIPSILDFCRENAAINVFLSHAVSDFDYFQIQEISKYLKQQSEIYQAYYCEEDLIGHIDDFMNEKVPNSQLLLFFASQKSVFNSVDCAHELELARKHGIQIIPIKGADINWEDLGEIGLGRELGYEFIEEDIKEFCEKIFVYIQKFKTEVNLFEAGEAKIDKQVLNIKNTLINLIDSAEFKGEVKENLKILEEIFKKLNSHQIKPSEYLQELVKILFKNNS